jgi:hypothetical protein
MFMFVVKGSGITRLGDINCILVTLDGSHMIVALTEREEGSRAEQSGAEHGAPGPQGPRQPGAAQEGR